MSLINDALKKAQRERTETTVEAPSFASEGTVSRSSPRRGASPASNMAPALIGAGVAVALIAIAGVGFFLFRGKPAAPTVETARTVTAPSAPMPTVNSTPSAPPKEEPSKVQVAEVAPLPTVHSEPAPTSAPAFKLNIPEAPASAKTTPAAVAKKVEPTPAPAAPIEAVPTTPGTPSAKMIDLIEALRVSGIRASGSDSKVLMNDRVYRVNDLVDRELGIRLIGVEPGALTFRDPSGAVYTRHF
jgi:hypothetical protein